MVWLCTCEKEDYNTKKQTQQKLSWMKDYVISIFRSEILKVNTMPILWPLLETNISVNEDFKLHVIEYKGKVLLKYLIKHSTAIFIST